MNPRHLPFPPRAQFGDPVLQRPQADPQHLGGAFAIAARVVKG
jgi:hypothetical protein